MVPTKLFGSAVRTRVLVFVALLRESYPRELARLANAPLISVQRIVDDLEREGVLASRLVGGSRIVALSKRLYGRDDLEAFLLKYAKRDPNLELAASALRRRPRERAMAEFHEFRDLLG